MIEEKFMNREEFLNGLQKALTGNVPAAVVQENLAYYRGYISEQVNHGRNEEEVIAEIGDPRLIAKTIVAATEGSNDTGYYQSAADSDYEQQSQRNTRDPFYSQDIFHINRFNKWYWKFAGIVILLLVLIIIGSLFAILIQLFIPIMIVLAIWWLIKLLRGR